MDLDLLKKGIETRVYHVPAKAKVPLHRHEDMDEIFYCIKGSGYGVLEDGEKELNEGEAFIAHAGKLHSIRSDNEIYVTAFLIPVNRVVCHCKQVTYGDIRKAMVSGARTTDEIKKITGAGTGCGGCLEEVERILSVACGCKNISIETVVKAVENGADTVGKIEETTGAGSSCGRCKYLLQNIIDTKK